MAFTFCISTIFRVSLVSVVAPPAPRLTPTPATSRPRSAPPSLAVVWLVYQIQNIKFMKKQEEVNIKIYFLTSLYVTEFATILTKMWCFQLLTTRTSGISLNGWFSAKLNLFETLFIRKDIRLRVTDDFWRSIIDTVNRRFMLYRLWVNTPKRKIFSILLS